ncbi:two-component response regulator, CheY-like protein [Pedobacter sp. BAL39]|uniref:response regulator n=1 Tax=Pedobacter sp. BAL39 TaxID=391596 RepID=UPI0001559D18|nr:response regulator [Pedobacter sp. BAL39]EDM35923.1 two-component response regulator, CheY-like protein [Pedobacter sp. BAL39]
MKEKINILLVDDDEINSFILKKLIEKVELRSNIQTCLNGEAALDYLKGVAHDSEKLPDIMFIDVNMPLMNGWELMIALPSLGIEKPIHKYILTSSFADVDLQKYKEFKSVLDGYIIKPISRERLQEIMEPYQSSGK